MTSHDAHYTLAPVAPFAGMRLPTAVGRGVRVTDRDGLGVAIVLARKGKSTALAQRARERFGLELPQRPVRASADNLAIMGTGPGTWLATHEQSSDAFAISLAEIFSDLASVSDQSDAYAILRLSGPKVRDTLCKLVPIDLHPSAFNTADVALTSAAHIGVTLWRLDDEADGSAVFDIAVFRSLAASFWHAIVVSAAEFGIVQDK